MATTNWGCDALRQNTCNSFRFWLLVHSLHHRESALCTWPSVSINRLFLVQVAPCLLPVVSNASRSNIHIHIQQSMMFATIDPKSRSIAELRAQSCAWPRSAPSAVHDPSVVMQGVRSYEAATCMAPNCTRLLDSNARHLYPRFQIAIRMNAEILAALRNCSFMYKIFAFLSSMSAFSAGDGRPWTGKSVRLCPLIGAPESRTPTGPRQVLNRLRLPTRLIVALIW
jgi:hypothetical protein